MIIQPPAPSTALPPMFECERRSLKLTISGCSKLWISANEGKAPEPYESRAACRGCPTGSMHATGKAPNPMLALAAMLEPLCARCGRWSERIINRETTGFCPSCDNRQREAVRGRNAKGNRPALADLLLPVQVAVTDGTRSWVVSRSAALGLEEVIIQQCRSATSVLAFGRPAVDWTAAFDRLVARQGLPWANLCGAGALVAREVRVVVMRAGRRRLPPLRATCRRGHEFTEANTMRGTDGWRRCRCCRQALRARAQKPAPVPPASVVAVPFDQRVQG